MSIDTVPITIRVIYDAKAPPFRAAALYASVEDVSRADAPASALASLVLQNIAHEVGEVEGPQITLQVSVPDPAAHLSARVHIDLDGDGSYSRGDFISMEGYPVLTHGHPDKVTVHVRQI